MEFVRSMKTVRTVLALAIGLQGPIAAVTAARCNASAVPSCCRTGCCASRVAAARTTCCTGAHRSDARCAMQAGSCHARPPLADASSPDPCLAAGDAPARVSLRGTAVIATPGFAPRSAHLGPDPPPPRG